MKKNIAVFLTIFCLALSLTLSSCSDDKSRMYCSIQSNCTYHPTATDEQKEQFASLVVKIDTRLVDMFGKIFLLEMDKDVDPLAPTEKEYNKVVSQIDNDAELTSYINQIGAVVDEEGNKVATAVYFHIFCGNNEVARYEIDF